MLCPFLPSQVPLGQGWGLRVLPSWGSAQGQGTGGERCTSTVLVSSTPLITTLLHHILLASVWNSCCWQLFWG